MLDNLTRSLPFITLLFVASGCLAQSQEIVLTSVDRNFQRRDWELSDISVNFDSAAVWKVTLEELRGGKQEGVHVVTIETEKLKIRVCPTRGMNVLDVVSGDVRLGWQSPVKEIVHPKFIRLSDRDGLGWLEGFNEWMVRCGVEFAGHPGKDEFINNTGDKAEMMLTLHGKIGNIPASEVVVAIDKRPPNRVYVRGTVYERGFYGPKLKVVTEISTVPGSTTFRINDTVTNEGAFDQEFQLIYHGNFGAPLLEKGAKVKAAAKSVTPMNAHAGKAVKTYDTYAGPTKGFVEEVYLLEPIANDKGRSSVMLHNAAGDRGASVTWSVKQLPFLTIWKNTAATESGYVTGLEPGTGYPFNRKVERKFGRVPKLKPGQTRNFTLDFGIHHGKESVDAAVAKIDALQGDVKATLNSDPPKLD